MAKLRSQHQGSGPLRFSGPETEDGRVFDLPVQQLPTRFGSSLFMAGSPVEFLDARAIACTPFRGPEAPSLPADRRDGGTRGSLLLRRWLYATSGPLPRLPRDQGPNPGAGGKTHLVAPPPSMSSAPLTGGKPSAQGSATIICADRSSRAGSHRPTCLRAGGEAAVLNPPLAEWRAAGSHQPVSVRSRAELVGYVHHESAGRRSIRCQRISDQDTSSRPLVPDRPSQVCCRR